MLQKSSEPNWTEPRGAAVHYFQTQSNPRAENCLTRLQEWSWIVDVSASRIQTELFSLERLIKDSIVRFKDMSPFSIYYIAISSEKHTQNASKYMMKEHNKKWIEESTKYTTKRWCWITLFAREALTVERPDFPSWLCDFLAVLNWMTYLTSLNLFPRPENNTFLGELWWWFYYK